MNINNHNQFVAENFNLGHIFIPSFTTKALLWKVSESLLSFYQNPLLHWDTLSLVMGVKLPLYLNYNYTKNTDKLQF